MLARALAAALLLMPIAAAADDAVPDGAPEETPANQPIPPEQPPAPPVLPIYKPATGPMTFADSNATRSVDCAGRTVVVRGTGNRLVLTGGCRGVIVDGAGNAVEAALQPGARIIIPGNAVTLTYTVTQKGEPPSVAITGSGSRATPAH